MSHRYSSHNVKLIASVKMAESWFWIEVERLLTFSFPSKSLLSVDDVDDEDDEERCLK